jgi:ribosome-associated heat shock protein Hsp15
MNLDGQRVKVSKEITVGDILRVRQGWDEKTIVVKQLCEQRRGAPQAQLLYEETAQSAEKRASEAEARKAAGGLRGRPEQRPTKKQRRQIHAFKKKPG